MRHFRDLTFFGVAAARICDLIVRSMPVCPLPRERKVTKKAARTLSIDRRFATGKAIFRGYHPANPANRR
jgi:hypothetical protein